MDGKKIVKKKKYFPIFLVVLSQTFQLLLLSNVACHNCVDFRWCDNNAWLSICRTILLFKAATDDLLV